MSIAKLKPVPIIIPSSILLKRQIKNVTIIGTRSLSIQKNNIVFLRGCPKFGNKRRLLFVRKIVFMRSMSIMKIIADMIVAAKAHFGMQ